MHGSTAFSRGSSVNRSMHATTRRPRAASVRNRRSRLGARVRFHASADELHLLAHPYLTLQRPKRCQHGS